MATYVQAIQTEAGQTKIDMHARALQTMCHGIAVECGWWRQPNRNVGEMLCLIHSEISEAMEGARKGLKDDHLPNRDMLEVELADAVIRIMDMSGGLGLDIGGAIAEKLAYNTKRADHKPENRDKAGGKKF
jgi:NTP pyrophosphatase (non-canonical NTP hydrolase)